MENFYSANIRQSNGKDVTFLVRYSKPSDPIYQEGALVYSDRVSYSADVDHIESHICGIPCIGIEFNALNHSTLDVILEKEYYDPSSIETIPDGIRWIGDQVFYKRRGNIKLPDSVEYLGATCFGYARVERILLPSTIRQLGASCFIGTELKEIVIPGSIKEIPRWCFANSDLCKIYVNEGVRSIDKNALDSRKEMPDKRIVILPKSISLIDDDALGRNFEGTVYAYLGSYAYFWAKEHKYHVETI